MLLALLITAALCLIAHFDPADAWRRKFLIWFGLYALVGAAWMAKFHYGAAMVFGPGVVYLLVRGWRRSLWHPLNPAGLLVLAGCVGLWPYAVLQRAPEAASVWQNETLGRAVGTMGSEPIWFYLPVLLGLSLPWTGAALAQMRASWREAFRDKDRREQFLWVWFLVQLGIVTVSADKHANYLLPVFSVMSIWSGRWVSRVWVRVERGESLCSRRFAGAAGLAICVVGVVGWVLGSAKWSYVSIELAWVSIVIGLGAIVALWRAATRRTVSGAKD